WSSDVCSSDLTLESYDNVEDIARGRLCGPPAQSAWSYDTVGRILTEKRTMTMVTPSVTKTISYTYDLGGNLKTITYPTGRVLTYTYSNAGRQVSAVDSTNSVNYATTATYAPFGALATVLQG